MPADNSINERTCGDRDTTIEPAPIRLLEARFFAPEAAQLKGSARFGPGWTTRAQGL